MSFSRQITGDVSGRLSPQSAAAATDPLLVERCILLSRTTVGTALSNAKCTSRRRATPEESGAAARGPCWLAGAPVVVAVRPLAPSRTPWRRRMSKSATKARIEPERRKRIVDIPRFSSRPIPARGAFVADFDTPPPQAVTGAPPAPPHAHPHPFTAPHPPLNRRF